MLAVGDPLPGLTVQLRTQLDGPILAREPVRGRDIAELLAELSFEAGLRSSGKTLPLKELSAKLRPVHRQSSDPKTQSEGRTASGSASGGEAGPKAGGFVLEATTPSGRPISCRFGRRVFEGTALRAKRRLVEEGKLSEETLCFFDIETSECRIEPLDLELSSMAPERRAIAPLLARAQRISGDAERGSVDEEYAREQSGRSDALHVVSPAPELDTRLQQPESHDYPVFYLRSAFEKAERISRMGAASTPAVETGGLLLGRACWCDESGTFFGVVDDALEASQSEGTTYSLTYSAETWGQIQRVLRARQRQPATRHQRILGQCHGHNFLPYAQGETCDGCPAQGSCDYTSAYLSESDRRWCRAVFPREPWQLSHVFGLSPRREPVSAFYGQRGASLVRRGYYLLDDEHLTPSEEASQAPERSPGSES